MRGDDEDAATDGDCGATGDEGGSATASALLSCPGCGRPITGLTSTGPHTGVVRPCGCSVAPGLIHPEPDRKTDCETDSGPELEPDRGTDRSDDE